MARHSQAGSSTAEVAVLMPAVAILLAVVAGAGAVGGEQVRIQQAASAAARELARGSDPGEAVGTAQRIAGGRINVSCGQGGGYGHVVVRSGVDLPLLGEVQLRAEARARTEQQP
ncbi:TadE family type IV pilus minor pilin [Paeniglutamicibacter sp. MACA_103]|uniref:TadE family type IV pilus minor pilin n=1 Tax=Paeniglutamicibacter sp. MACA_103 TaxID=3377337 RepID=UPI0038939B47